jgi:hypothetical protein
MSGDIEAAADLVSGALLARTVDGGHGGGADAHHPALCLNCGTRLIGPHCHRCGQSGHVHRTVGAIGHEIAHGVFHFEGKVWRTVPMLVLHPGTLTRRYIDGERVRFVAPLALFLFTVFLLFATISWVGGELNGIAHATPEAKAGELAKLDRSLADNRKLLASETALHPGDPPTERIVSLRSTIASLETARVAFAGGTDTPIDVHGIHSNWPRLDHGIRKAAANPGLALYKLQSSAYKYSWLLIPLSTPFVALLFLWRRRFGLYDHAVFVTYSLCFMMMLVATVSLAGAAGASSGLIAVVMMLAPPVHMFAQLRGTYALGRWGALWRTTILLSFAFVALAGFITLLLLHGLTE